MFDRRVVAIAGRVQLDMAGEIENRFVELLFHGAAADGGDHHHRPHAERKRKQDHERAARVPPQVAPSEGDDQVHFPRSSFFLMDSGLRRNDGKKSECMNRLHRLQLADAQRRIKRREQRENKNH